VNKSILILLAESNSYGLIISFQEMWTVLQFGMELWCRIMISL